MWTARVREWKESGVSAKRFAEGKGLTVSTLRRWASRVRKLDGDATTGETLSSASTTGVNSIGIRMLRVRTKSPTPRVSRAFGAAALTVTVGAARIDVDPGFDAMLLRQVVEALGGAP